jgi:hypothetical protein
VSTRVKLRRVSYPFVESNIAQQEPGECPYTPSLLHIVISIQTEIPFDATPGVHVIPGPRLRRPGAHPILLDPQAAGFSQITLGHSVVALNGPVISVTPHLRFQADCRVGWAVPEGSGTGAPVASDSSRPSP